VRRRPVTSSVSARIREGAQRRLQRLILERRYGMPPGALREVPLREVGLYAPDRVGHVASPWGALSLILDPSEVTPDDVFLDLGCGMGSVIIEAAARYSFRRVIGVDIAPQFTEVARETIGGSRSRMRCQDVDVVTTDVLDYEIPDVVTVVYMFDPFKGPILGAAVAKLIASVDRARRRLRLIYYEPHHSSRLERTGRVRLARVGRLKRLDSTLVPELVMYELLTADKAMRPVRESGPGRQPARTRAAASVRIRQSGSPASTARVAFSGAEEDLDALRSAFERDRCVYLPGLLGEAIRERAGSYIDAVEFRVQTYGGMATERCMDRGEAAALLMFLTNDPDLFRLVQAITACPRIAHFHARIYQMPPGPEFEEFWQGDLFETPKVAMSINLGHLPYRGGNLVIRDRRTARIINRAEAAEPGDALLFRVAPTLQHRVTAVEGDVPRTVYAGRFEPPGAIESFVPPAASSD
jgi:SAM-dependent methyltransferase